MKTIITWACRAVVATAMIFAVFPATGRNLDLSLWQTNLSGVSSLEEDDVDPYYQWREQWSNLVVVGETVHTAWLSQRWEGEIQNRIVYRRSTDRGVTWQSPIVVANGYPGGRPHTILSNQNAVQMCVSGQTVHIVESRSYSPEGANWYYRLIYHRSTNGGASFEPEKIIHTGTDIWHIEDCRIAAAGQRAVVAFHTRANWYANYSINVLVSDDNGGNFRLCPVVASNDRDGSLEELALSNGGIHVMFRQIDQAYYYGSFQARIGLATSLNGGTSFQAKFLTTPVAAGEYAGYYYALGTKDYHSSPDLAVDGANIHAIWSQYDTNYSGNRVLMHARSVDQGMNFQAPIVIHADNALYPGQESIAAKSGRVYVTYPTTDNKIWLRRSTNGGASFFAAQEISNTGGWWPAIALDPADATGATFYACWAGNTYRYSKDSGASLEKPMVAYPCFTTSSVVERPQFAVASGELHMTWNGSLLGSDLDIFYRAIRPQPAPGTTAKAVRLQTVPWDNGQRVDNVQINNRKLDFTGAMSADVWLREEAVGITTGSSEVECPVIVKESAPLSGSYQTSYAMGTMAGSGARVAYARIKTTNGEVRIVAPAAVQTVAPATWTHLAMTYNAAGGADNFKLYQNGGLVASATVTGDIAPATGNFFVGRYGDWTVDNLALWNRSISQEEIRSGMRTTRAGTEGGLVAFYGFDGTLRDKTTNRCDGFPMYRESYVPGYMPPPKGNQTITFTLPTGKRVGNAPFTLNGTASSGLAVTYVSADPTIARLNGNMLEIRKAGSVVITASQSGDDQWNAAPPVARTMAIAKGKQTIAFTLKKSQRFELNRKIRMNGKATSGLAVRYASSNRKVVLIKGRYAIIKGRGKVVITASQPGNGNWLASPQVQRTTVIK